MTVQSFASSFRPYNPFIAMIDEQPLAIDVVEETESAHVSYALVQNGPAVAAEEVESHLDAVEVKVTWGTQVLAVSHLETGKGYSIGEGGDFVVPSFAVKTDIVGVRGGSWFVSVPAGATATVFARGESPCTLNAGEQLDVRPGMRVSMECDGVTIEVSAVRAGKKLAVGFFASLATGAAAAIGLSFFGHAAIVASMALFMPSMGANDADVIDRDQFLSMQTLMDASANREQDRLKEEAASAESAPGGQSPSSEGPSGTSGTPTPASAPGRIAVKGTDDHSRPTSRQEMVEEARTKGMIEILRDAHSDVGHDGPWADEAGQDARDAHGDTKWIPNIGETPGSGYGPSGDGKGGGGTADVILIDGVDTGRGKGKWPGNGDNDGFGNDHGVLKGSHAAKAPAPLREGVVNANGHLPAEVIQRIVRQNFGRFRVCYEAGLRGNPTLRGRVVTKFVIGRDGAVMQSMDGGSDLPNQEVVSCVVRSFQNVSFPTPEAGIVTVSYPISFEPGE